MAFRFGRLCRFYVYGFRVDGVSVRRFGLDVYAVSAFMDFALMPFRLAVSVWDDYRRANGTVMGFSTEGKCLFIMSICLMSYALCLIYVYVCMVFTWFKRMRG
jgi:hypothetical protein